MSFLYKVLKSESPSHLFNTIPNSNNRQHQTRNSGNIPSFFAKHDYFKNSFFPSTITEWNKLDCYIRNADAFKVFKKCLLSFIRPMTDSIYNIHNPLGVKHLTRRRIGFSHLKEHKVKHDFQDSIDPMCSCSSGIEKTIHFFLRCTNFNIQRQTLVDKIATIDANILTENSYLVNKPNCENYFKKAMLNASIEYILSIERFINPLFN